MPPKTKMTPEQVVEDLKARDIEVRNPTKEYRMSKEERDWTNDAVKAFRVIIWPHIATRNKLHPPV